MNRDTKRGLTVGVQRQYYITVNFVKDLLIFGCQAAEKEVGGG